MADEPKNTGEFDILIANSIYPEAEAIFTTRLRPLEEIKDDCYIVLDTNALLVPYGTGKESLDQIRQTYATLVAEKRLVVPGQVAREFAENRANKLRELYQQLSRKRNVPQLQKGKYPLLESVNEYQQTVSLEKEIDELLRKYQETIGKVLDHIRGWNWDDPVSLMYGELFVEDVILDPAIDEAKVRSELARRQLHKIPPGYKDSTKDDDGVGDLLIWFTILKIGEAYKKTVVFVSGEEKADWWYRSENQPLYPRYELVDEFRRQSEGQSFHIIELSRLLSLYGASESVVAQVRQEEREVGVGQVSIQQQAFRAEEAVFEWLRTTYPNREIVRNDPRFPDFIVVNLDGTRTGVEVEFVRHGMAVTRLRDTALRGYHEVSEGELDDFIIVIVSDYEALADELTRTGRKILPEIRDVSIWIGYVTSRGWFSKTLELRDGRVTWQSDL